MQKKTESTESGKKKPVSKSKAIVKELSKLLENVEPVQTLAQVEAAKSASKLEGSLWGKSRFDAPAAKISKIQELKAKFAGKGQALKIMGAGLLAFSLGLSGYAWFAQDLPDSGATARVEELALDPAGTVNPTQPIEIQKIGVQQDSIALPIPVVTKSPLAPEKNKLTSNHKSIKETKQKKATKPKIAAKKQIKDKKSVVKNQKNSIKKAKKILASKGTN